MTYSIVGEGLDPPAVPHPPYVILSDRRESKDPFSFRGEYGFGSSGLAPSAQNDRVFLRLTPTGGLKIRPYKWHPP